MEIFYDLGNSKPGLCINVEGWDGEEGERRHVYTYGGFMLMYGRTTQFCKTIVLQLESQLKILKRKRNVRITFKS